MNCTNNTQGNHCEKCIHGYYGDPENNIPCVECDCNGLSPTCDMSGVCDDCAEGYRGDHCEECDNGYHVRMCTSMSYIHSVSIHVKHV